jgi:integrase
MAVLRRMESIRTNDRPDALIFPGGRTGKSLSGVSMARAVCAAGGSSTVHGFRSAFRDWCAEATNFPRELAEKALAHSLSNAVEAAYQRGDMFEKRRKLMQAWADFCARPASTGKVVQLNRAG